MRIGVDLGGTNIAVGLVDDEGRIVATGSRPTKPERGYEAVAKDIAEIALELINRTNTDIKEIKSMGIGVPGVADSEKGIVIRAVNLFWTKVPLAKEIKKYIDLPIYMDNDANVAALAEAVFGAGRGSKSSVTITLGTGVGSGFVLDGKIYNGAHHFAPEIGHIVIGDNGIRCNCGKIGCLETYASATALIREGKRAAKKDPNSLILKFANGDIESITAKNVIDAAKQYDEEAIKIFNDYVKYLAIGIVNVINMFDPEVIILGGGVANAGDFLIKPLKKEVAENILFKDLPYADIRKAELGNDAGIIGAAILG
ncbi:glucokinase, ROK family [Thermoanaerobacter mathranii subsp. mathranii str. A3]|uniref:Glucokinase n=3 Tax=Thermoanaerobacter TaxID=1754 RepID=D3T454_THEIA|nr:MULTISPECIES: ROK family protein [Thermoanaerobacter]ADD03006.1 glucokinase, ROK family [Thermoanaerobacter italicus Ab9]ADH61443.1 glucokinase, ROK family [Thermoanaerobacter mathranii subsp. mathranii str. A3]MDP9751393.1 glucokinase [Thermoanaerobacter pentosaceus]